jgi:DNA polymerase III delta prime subunit
MDLNKQAEEFDSKVRGIYLDAMAEKLSEIIEADYKEFKELYPNGDIPEWIIFIDKKYGTPN